jgi:hypothetical protein
LRWTEEASDDLREFSVFLTAAQQFALELLRERFPQALGLPALDIGFGAGWFLGALGNAGFVPHGLEAADAPVRTLSAKGFAVRKSTDATAPSDWPQPALISAFEVLEHLEDPIGFLTRLRNDYPEAELVLSVPDERRWFLLGGREAHDYPPNHLTRWSPTALKLALLKAGFQEAHVWHVQPTAQEMSMASIRRFLPFCASGCQAGSALLVTPATTLSQELNKRNFRRRCFYPLVPLLRLFGKTACSMVALGSNRVSPKQFCKQSDSSLTFVCT